MTDRRCKAYHPTKDDGQCIYLEGHIEPHYCEPGLTDPEEWESPPPVVDPRLAEIEAQIVQVTADYRNYRRQHEVEMARLRQQGRDAAMEILQPIIDELREAAPWMVGSSHEEN